MSNTLTVEIPETIVGFGAIDKIPDVVKRFAPKRVLVLTDSGVVNAGLINAMKPFLEMSGCKFEVFDGCHHEPSYSLVDQLASKVKAEGIDLLIGVGGGTVMDTTKTVSVTAANNISCADWVAAWKDPNAVAKMAKPVHKGLIPTTAGTGSEWSVVCVIYNDGAGNQVEVIPSSMNLPEVVLIDPDLTLGLPSRVTADTGIDALTHAIEAYTSCAANVFSEALAASAIEMIAGNLRAAFAKGNNKEARLKLAMAAPMAMNAANCGGLGICHLMNEPLGVRAHITHGAAVGLLLPYVMEFNLIGNPVKFAKVAQMMGEDITGLTTAEAAELAVEAVRKLCADLGLPQTLTEVGVGEELIPTLVEEVLVTKAPMIQAWNPRNADRKDLTRIYTAAL